MTGDKGSPRPARRLLLIDHLDTKLFPENGGGPVKGMQCHPGVRWIKQAIKLRAARLHGVCHLGLIELPLLHAFRNLPRDDLLNSRLINGLKDAVFLKETFEAGPDGVVSRLGHLLVLALSFFFSISRRRDSRFFL